MLINNNKTKTLNSNLLKNLLLLIFINLLSSTQVGANGLNVEQYTISQGLFKKDLNDQQRKHIIKENKHVPTPDQLSGKATAKTRVDMLNIQKKNAQNKINEQARNGLTASNINSDYYADFTIYGATTLLQEDYDNDGFYQTFSVIFDADIYSYTDNQYSEVYALLYISKNGGPWTHYYSTDTFIIEGNSNLDEYEVITTLVSGYSSEYYDVLIDLYQVGYSDIVASYSSDDSNALYALPIESADFDEPYSEPNVEAIEVHGGSMVWLGLCLLGAYFIRLKFY